MYKEKHILIVVPARGGSKGIKLKNLKEINGVPLVGMVGKVVQKISISDRAIVSTDHAEIAQVAKKYGLDVPFFRSESLSGDRIADIDVLKEALLKVEELDKKEYDIIVMLQPTSPSRTPQDVIMAIKKVIDNNLDSVWSVSETDSKAHPLKQLIIKENNLLDYYDREGKKIIARQQLNPVYHRNGIVYVITRECIIEKNNICGEKWAPLIIDRNTINIDTEYDLKIAEILLADKGSIL